MCYPTPLFSKITVQSLSVTLHAIAMTPDVLKVRVQLTFKEVYRALFPVLIGAKTPWQWAISFLKNLLYASALFFTFNLLFAGRPQSYLSLAQTSILWGVLFLVTFTPIFLLIFPFLMLAVLGLSKRAFLLTKPVVYSFFPDHIETHTATFQSTVPWSHFFMIRETKREFLLYFRKSAASIVPKHCFTNEVEIKGFKDLVRTSFQGQIVFLSS
jgi:hypothetical protein